MQSPRVSKEQSSIAYLQQSTCTGWMHKQSLAELRASVHHFSLRVLQDGHKTI